MYTSPSMSLSRCVAETSNWRISRSNNHWEQDGGNRGLGLRGPRGRDMHRLQGERRAVQRGLTCRVILNTGSWVLYMVLLRRDVARQFHEVPVRAQHL